MKLSMCDIFAIGEVCSPPIFRPGKNGNHPTLQFRLSGENSDGKAFYMDFFARGKTALVMGSCLAMGDIAYVKGTVQTVAWVNKKGSKKLRNFYVADYVHKIKNGIRLRLDQFEDASALDAIEPTKILGPYDVRTASVVNKVIKEKHKDEIL